MSIAKRETKLRVLTTSLFNLYVRDYGEIKAQKLVTSIEGDSDRIRNFLLFWEAKNIVPSQHDLQKIIGSINWFVFSKRETMAIACLILLAKWERQVNSNLCIKSELEVLQIGISIVSYYKVYKAQSEDVVMSLYEIEQNKAIVNEDVNQLLGKIHTCINDATQLHIAGINYCAAINLDSPGSEPETIDYIDCEVYLTMKHNGLFTANFFDYLPDYIKTTFSIYTTSENQAYDGSWVSFRIRDISLNKNLEINFLMESNKKFIEIDSGEIISISENTNSLIVYCYISEAGMLFSSHEHGWSFLLGGEIETWVYD
jgi:hypothetical protein